MSRILTLQTADAASLARYETIIDVRSPGEFAKDHLPGAINLPVLTDEERAEVGTIYVQESRLKANRIGAAYVARNIARHLETALADRPQTFAPLVYCWRGGQRSESMATILSRIGWRTSLLAGGYRTYRRHVQARLYDETWPLKVVLLDGDTGTGKTEILGRLGARGLQTLDLEGMAGHRGSLFGGLPGQPQPDQKGFESALLRAMEALDPARLVVVEAESSRIGDLMVPPALWARMQAAPRIEVAAPREARARYLVSAYSDITADHDLIEAVLGRLPVHPSQTRLEGWRALLAAGDYAALAEALMELHYDPAYRRGRRKDGREPLAVIAVETLDGQSLDQAADEIVRLVQALPSQA
ncbi:MAG: tRNA 2-selenouridine(34) synthase MnmH [Caulobacter sp.]|nr:tRNA 2-selenouridine(34) synthase MnmH [Caulobacter sp.]